MKVAIVTGASKGIGTACALRLAADGYAVAVNYAHNDEEAKKVLDEIVNNGGTAKLYKADVSDKDAVRKMVREIDKDFGGIDLLVNNAGIVRDEYLLMMNPDTLDKCFDLNVKGYFYMSQQVALKMFRKKSGVIINMSSVSGLTRTMAKELGGYGIRVNAVAPGFVRTEMLDHIPEEKKEEYLKAIPLHRLAEVEEVASLVSVLASDACSYMTGQILTMDGGLSL